VEGGATGWGGGASGALPVAIALFWQKTQRKLQPEKKTAPLPPVPERQGSS